MKENDVNFFKEILCHNNSKNPTCFLDEKRRYFSFSSYATEVNWSIWFHGCIHADQMKIFIEILVFFSTIKFLNYFLAYFAGLEILDHFATLLAWLFIAEYGVC